MDEAPILVDARAGYRIVTLNRPQRLNAFNEVMHRALSVALDEAEADESCRALLLTGAGRGFCAGQDLADRVPQPGHKLTKKIQGVTVKKLKLYCCDYTVRTIEYFDNNGKPVAIAELNDYTQVTENFSIPASIEIYSPPEDVENQFNIKINLTPIREATDKQKNFSIVRDDDPQGFKHVYKVVNGQWYEQ